MAAEPSTLFGVSRGVERQTRDEYALVLSGAWYALFSRRPGDLDRDLEALRPIFKAAASGRTVRELVDDLGASPSRHRSNLPPAVLIPVDDERALITPEGRVLLEVLERLRLSNGEIIGTDDLAWATAVIAELYGSWQREWLVKLLRGGDLRPATFASALFLLINNNAGPELALRLPADEEGQAALASVLVPVFNGFVAEIGGKPLPMDTRLQSHWAMTELSRQLPQHVARRRSPDGTTLLFTKSDSDAALAEHLGDLLAVRRGLTEAQLEAAISSLVAEYRIARPRLAAWGLAHEKPARTKRLLDSLRRSFGQARATRR